MGLIDTHCHPESFLRRGEWGGVAERARAAGLAGLIAVGTGPDDWDLYRDLATADPGWVHYTAGLHPCAVTDGWPDAQAALRDFWTGAKPRPVALGEIGLDRFHLPADPAEAGSIFARQRAAFASGLALARELGCPVVIHSRGAFAECVELIAGSGVEWSRVVFHCFSEGPAEIAELNRRGARGSFTGILTYKNAGALREAAVSQGLDRLMLETDAPYLAPVPLRGKTNEPAWLVHTAALAAETFRLELPELVRRTTENAREFFGI